MRTLALQDKDLVLSDGSFLMADGDTELAQSIQNALSTAKGEWFLDEEYGLERDALLGKFFNEGEATDAIVDAVMQDERIASVESVKYGFDKASRTLSVSLTLRKQDDETLDMEVTI